MAELSGISSFCGEYNLRGVRTIRYLPVAWLDTGEYEEYINTAGNFQKAINPSLGGQVWLTLPFFPARGDGWQESHRKTDQGSEYGQQIEGVVPKLRPDVSAEFELMQQHLFIIRLTDQNGKNWLIGREHEPLEFVVTGESGSRSGGLSSYNFQFTGTTSRRAFGYSPVF